MKNLKILGALLPIVLASCVGDTDDPQVMQRGNYTMTFNNGLVNTVADSGNMQCLNSESEINYMEVNASGGARLFNPNSIPGDISNGMFTNPINNDSVCFTGALDQVGKLPMNCGAINSTSTLQFTNCTTYQNGNSWNFRAVYFVYSTNSDGKIYPVLQGNVVGVGG
ncbi:MAG: hypothetical protein EKK64_09040 [Neisseriaceae bacterium]|nr:MAG: hypothetical protein EKK64_09040 [Neisseriaceae bacterium]